MVYYSIIFCLIIFYSTIFYSIIFLIYYQYMNLILNLKLNIYLDLYMELSYFYFMFIERGQNLFFFNFYSIFLGCWLFTFFIWHRWFIIIFIFTLNCVIHKIVFKALILIFLLLIILFILTKYYKYFYPIKNLIFEGIFPYLV